MQTLFAMYFSLRRYQRFADVAQHLLRAERELLSGFTLILRSFKDAAAPHAKEDPIASLLFEVFHFLERALSAVMPQSAALSDSELMKTTQRRALFAIREVLLDERAAITPDAAQSRQRSEVVDAILLVLDRELQRLDFGGEDHTAERAEATTFADADAAPLTLSPTGRRY